MSVDYGDGNRDGGDGKDEQVGAGEGGVGDPAENSVSETVESIVDTSGT